jgi:RNA polymerase sigma-70 factor (ECF subfamily)
VAPDEPARLTPLREMQLVEAYRLGGPSAREALSELLWSYQHRIYSICYRMLGNRDDASDLTQDALLKMMEGLEGYDGRSKLSTWVIRVAINCCLSHIRRQKLRDHASLDDGARGKTYLDEGSGSGRVHEHSGGHMDRSSGRGQGREHSPPESVEHDQTRDSLLRVFNTLDDETRAILILRDLQDLDYQQLAEVLDVPLGTVKSRLFRARESLRRALESFGHE